MFSWRSLNWKGLTLNPWMREGLCQRGFSMRAPSMFWHFKYFLLWEKKLFGEEVLGYKLFSSTGNVLIVCIMKPYFTTPDKQGFLLESPWGGLTHLLKVTGDYEYLSFLPGLVWPVRKSKVMGAHGQEQGGLSLSAAASYVAQHCCLWKLAHWIQELKWAGKKESSCGGKKQEPCG